jgi:hypothetical protein
MMKGYHEMSRKFILLLLIATPAFGQDSDFLKFSGTTATFHGVTVTCAKPADNLGNHMVFSPPPQPTWHLLTKSHVGTISLLKNLTEHECQFARARALGLPATPEEIEARKADDEKWFKDNPGATVRPGGVYTVSDGDIETAECFE